MSIDLEVILTWHYDIDYLVDGHITAAVTHLLAQGAPLLLRFTATVYS